MNTLQKDDTKRRQISELAPDWGQVEANLRVDATRRVRRIGEHRHAHEREVEEHALVACI